MHQSNFKDLLSSLSNKLMSKLPMNKDRSLRNRQVKVSKKILLIFHMKKQTYTTTIPQYQRNNKTMEIIKLFYHPKTSKKLMSSADFHLFPFASLDNSKVQKISFIILNKSKILKNRSNNIYLWSECRRNKHSKYNFLQINNNSWYYIINHQIKK